MTERIDHAAEATSDLRYADEAIETGADDVARAIAAIAQVHATLALVEQQRIANLIALAHPIKLPSGGEVTHMLHDPVSGAIRDDVAEGLGL